VQASVEVMEGDPLSAITGLVESLKRPMVVIDASAKSRLHRLLTGSLPDKVVRGSGVPVLLAPEKLGLAIH
jgi:nucleotide-binding universal stress UspA family protein